MRIGRQMVINYVTEQYTQVYRYWTYPLDYVGYAHLSQANYITAMARFAINKAIKDGYDLLFNYVPNLWRDKENEHLSQYVHPHECLEW